MKRLNYGIVVNPAAGKLNSLSKDAILRVLEPAVRIFGGCEIAGLDTANQVELAECSKDLASKVDVLVHAGGDGTGCIVRNAVPPDTVLGSLPLGAGDALHLALSLPRSVGESAKRIYDGSEHSIDMILCKSNEGGEMKAVLATLGFISDVADRREDYRLKGINGFGSYVRSTRDSLHYKPSTLDIKLDGRGIHVPDFFTAIFTKIPFIGYGLKVVPKAKLDDGLMHILYKAHYTFLDIPVSLATSRFLPRGNIVGTYTTGKSVTATTSSIDCLQIDGSPLMKGTKFEFSVLPGLLKMRY